MNLKKGNRLDIPTMIQSFRDILWASRADKGLDLKLVNDRFALTCSCHGHTLELLLHQRRLFWTGSSNTSQHASPLQVPTQSSRLLFFSSASISLDPRSLQHQNGLPQQNHHNGPPCHCSHHHSRCPDRLLPARHPVLPRKSPSIFQCSTSQLTLPSKHA